MNVKFTSSPWGFRETPFEEQCDFLKSLGIDYICGQFADFSGLFNTNITDEELMCKYQLVQDKGLQFASINIRGDFMVFDGLDNEIQTAFYDIERAAKLDAKILIVFAGWIERDDDQVYMQVIDVLREVSKYAAKYNLTVALENHGGLTASIEQCNRILSGVNESNIGLNYDPANFLMYGQNPLEALEQLKHPVVFAHLKNVKIVDEKKVYCRIKEGLIDYRPIIEKLIKTYNGFYALEYEESLDVFEGTMDDFEFLKTVIGEF